MNPWAMGGPLDVRCAEIELGWHEPMALLSLWRRHGNLLCGVGAGLWEAVVVINRALPEDEWRVN